MNCPKCGYWLPLCKCNGNGKVYTSKDKLWEFETFHLGKRIPIRSKGQWKRYMKKYGLHDDTPKRPDFTEQSYKPVSRKFIAEKMMERLQERGVYHKLVPELRKALKK